MSINRYIVFLAKKPTINWWLYKKGLSNIILAELLLLIIIWNNGDVINHTFDFVVHKSINWTGNKESVKPLLNSIVGVLTYQLIILNIGLIYLFHTNRFQKSMIQTEVPLDNSYQILVQQSGITNLDGRIMCHFQHLNYNK